MLQHQSVGRRERPRVNVESFCSELDDTHERHALVVDLSDGGLRVQRPVGGAPRKRVLQLEFEIPEIDEVVWATGEICFDQVWQLPPKWPGALAGLVRTSGIRLLATTQRHRRMLREYVHDTWRSRELTRDETRQLERLWLTGSNGHHRFG
jgi:hypothetical protein